jgi:PilZ domain-containing protein
VQTAVVNVEPEQFLAGWQPGAGRLFLPVLSQAVLGDVVAVRVGLAGHDLRATVFGMVSLTRRLGRPSLPPGVELQLDVESQRAATWLAQAARGEPVSARPREPRFAAEREVVARRGRVELAVLTVNVSESGCSLRWSGHPPEPGELLALRIGEGLLAPAPPAVVAWATDPRTGAARVGVRIVAHGGRASRAWLKLAADAARRGAMV